MSHPTLEEIKARNAQLKRALAGHLFDGESVGIREAIRSELIMQLAKENERLRAACTDLLRVFEPPSKLSDSLIRKETDAIREALKGEA